MFTRLRQGAYWQLVVVGMLLVILGAYQVMAQDSAAGEAELTGIRANCTPTRPAGWITYVIQPNDTLSGIAARTGSSVQELVRVNCISNRRLIQPGAEIFVPLPIDDNHLAERCRLAGLEPERCRALIFGDDNAIAERCRLAGIEPERCRALFGRDDNHLAERCRLAGLEPERCRALIFGDDDNLTERCRLAGLEPERCRALVFGDNEDDRQNNNGQGSFNNVDAGDAENVGDGSGGDNHDNDDGDDNDRDDGEGGNRSGSNRGEG